MFSRDHLQGTFVKLGVFSHQCNAVQVEIITLLMFSISDVCYSSFGLGEFIASWLQKQALRRGLRSWSVYRVYNA